MDETRYHAITDATLMHCFDQLDDAFEAGALEDLDLTGGVLTIMAESGRVYLMSKHAPSQQLWLASPVSGGLHFSYDETEQRWYLPDGRLLYDLLRSELAAEGIDIIL